MYIHFQNKASKKIFILSTVSTIGEYAFENCKNLTKVEISPNSNLHIVESFSFSELKIKDIFIPSKISKISNCAFSNCKNLQIV